MDGWNATFLLGRPIFRGEHVGFRGVAALKTLRAVLNFVKQLWRFAKQATQAMWPGHLTVPFCNKGVISTGKDLRPSLQEFHPIPTSKFEIGKDSSIQSLTFY